MTKAELLATNIVGTTQRDERTGEPFFALWDANTLRCIGSVDRDYFNALRSTSLVHKHIEQTLRSLDDLSALMLSDGREEWAQTVDIIAAGLVLGQRVALVGIEELAAHVKRKD